MENRPMNREKEKIERDITASKTCIKTYLKCIKADETCIINHQADIDKAEKELAELEKPELRHGDYGLHGKGGDNWIKIQNKLHYIGNDNYFGDCGIAESAYAPNKVGNLIADLKSLSEPLAEFELSTGQLSAVKCFWGSDPDILNIRQGNDLIAVHKNWLLKFILNLRRMQAGEES